MERVSSDKNERLTVDKLIFGTKYLTDQYDEAYLLSLALILVNNHFCILGYFVVRILKKNRLRQYLIVIYVK